MKRPSSPKAKRRPEPFDAIGWFHRHGVFRRDEFLAAHAEAGRSSQTTQTLLKYHVAQGRLLALRRGLYCTADGSADPWTLACKLTDDAVLAYDGAADVHGLSRNPHSLTILSAQRLDHFVHSEIIYGRVKAEEPRKQAGVQKLDRGYNTLYVTTRERTLVDLLDRLDLVPVDWRDPEDEDTEDTAPLALWEIFQKAGPLDADEMVQRARAIGSHTLAARLGLFLENLGSRYQHALAPLQRLRPPAPLYFHRANRDGKHTLVSRWNLVVNHDLLLKVERGT